MERATCSIASRATTRRARRSPTRSSRRCRARARSAARSARSASSSSRRSTWSTTRASRGFDTTKVLGEVQNANDPFAYVQGTHFQSSFGHLVGYDAGYYGYQWALSLSRDVLTRFKKEGMLNTETARAWRDDVLSKGGGEDERAMVTRVPRARAEQRRVPPVPRGEGELRPAERTARALGWRVPRGNGRLLRGT